jgi:hypothetical protein
MIKSLTTGPVYLSRGARFEEKWRSVEFVVESRRLTGNEHVQNSSAFDGQLVDKELQTHSFPQIANFLRPSPDTS